MDRNEPSAETDGVRLREVAAEDLPIFFEHQRDPDATRMAAFPARDREAFMAHWAKIRVNPTGITQTILCDGQVAGYIGSWEQEGDRAVGYWLGQAYWGRGIATQALAAFLQLVTVRPLYAHVAQHNLGSRRVLEKCGFTVYDEGQEGADADGEAIIEVMLVLPANAGDAAQPARHLAWDACYNVRDVGDYPTKSGGRTRWQ